MLKLRKQGGKTSQLIKKKRKQDDEKITNKNGKMFRVFRKNKIFARKGFIPIFKLYRQILSNNRQAQFSKSS